MSHPGFSEESPDSDKDPIHKETHFWHALDGFLTALEKKKPQEFFDEAWALAEKANKQRYGDDLPKDPSKAFGSREVSQKQKSSSAKMWQMLDKTVDLDRTFEGYREDKFSQLGFTIEGLRGMMNMSKGFILTTENRIAFGLKDVNRGKYSYLAFKHDMIEEFGFGEDQHPKTPIHQISRAGTRTRLKKELVANMGEDKAEKFETAIGLLFVDVAGAAIFAHAEASMELANAHAGKNSEEKGR